MGAWGAGNFENDDALDLLGELTPESCAARLAEIFEAVSTAGMQGESLEAPDGCNVLAAAELIAAARGYASRDLPDEAGPLVEALKEPAAELAQKAASAVSSVLMASSELVELWAESDERKPRPESRGRFHPSGRAPGPRCTPWLFEPTAPSGAALFLRYCSAAATPTGSVADLLTMPFMSSCRARSPGWVSAARRKFTWFAEISPGA